ncbi:hypothetical protein MNV49_005059 [Pseudohyphozyma bogoriensis]|nr:hypothetical protein MNV49_005059 [Pseudohyphozyma bogoriensis]
MEPDRNSSAISTPCDSIELELERLVADDEMPQSTSLLDLPNEILLTILQPLRDGSSASAPEPYLAISLTCKRLQCIVKPLIWQTVCITSNQKYNKVLNALVRDPTAATLIRTLRFRTIPKPFENIIFSFPGLALHAAYFDCYEISKTLTDALRNADLSQLRHLEFTRVGTFFEDESFSFIGLATSLTSLAVSPKPIPKAVAELGPLVESLSIQDIDWVNEALSVASEGFLSATSLRLRSELEDFPPPDLPGQLAERLQSIRATTTFIAVFPGLTHLVLWDWLSEEGHDGSWAAIPLADLVIEHPLVFALLTYLQLTTKIVSLRFESLHCYREKADPETPFVREDILREVDGEFKL